MNVSLSPEMQRYLDEKLSDGTYKSADDAIEAGLASLQLLAEYGNFRPGELDVLLAEGEADIARGELVDGEAFFDALDRRTEDRRRRTTK